MTTENGLGPVHFGLSWGSQFESVEVRAFATVRHGFLSSLRTGCSCSAAEHAAMHTGAVREIMLKAVTAS